MNPDAPVAPGDNLRLLSGDHGVCTIMDAHEPDYIAITADEGATPVLQRLALIGAERFVIAGPTVRGEAGGDLGGTLVDLTTHGWRGPCRYVVVRDCLVTSGDHFAIRDNVLRNVDFGVSVSGDVAVVDHNLETVDLGAFER